MELRKDAPSRDVTEVGAGDFVLIKRTWKQIESNTAEGQPRTPRSWIVKTTDGGAHGMYEINRYAKAEDLVI